MTYDAADDSRKSYDLAISEKRKELLLSKAVQIGDARLFNADCLEILPLLGNVDAVVTDPPYGIGFAGQPTKWQRRAGHETMGWDDRTIDKLFDVLAIGTIQVVWGGNYYSLPVSRGWLCWFKPDAPPSMSNVEMAWTNIDQNSKHITHSIGATNAERVGHPTQKPLRVMLWALQQIPFADAIIDPFMGSGTTGVACAKLGRKFIGIELEPKYFDIACKRIEEAYAQPDMFVEPPAKPVQEDLL